MAISSCTWHELGMDSRRHCASKLFKSFRGLEITECPFANLPEARSGRWGEGLTGDKMKECQWLKPALFFAQGL